MQVSQGVFVVCHVQVSQRDLRLTYFPPFKACIDAGTYNLMCSYYRFVSSSILSSCCCRLHCGRQALFSLCRVYFVKSCVLFPAE